MTNSPSTPTIAVLGLGAMGTAIARSCARAGTHVVAWNRTPRRAADLGLDDTAQLEMARSPEAAADAADLVVICVRDHDAARRVLRQIAPALREQVVVNVSTGTPDATVETAALAGLLGVRYVTGAVMVPTPVVGTDSCLVLYAGAPEDLAELTVLGDGLGGTSDLTGSDHAVPAALDLAMLDIFFTGMYAHLHATALASAHGIDPGRFLPYAQAVVETLRDSLPGLTASVELRTYATGEARLDMCLAFLETIVASSREAGIPPAQAELVRAASARALERWPGSTDWDVVAEDLRAPGGVAAPAAG
jgi:3-hydroxyisobutyrate dehydrogenase-like beta-hydroxyacid dehydrogenase